MATVVLQHVRHIGHHLSFFENFLLRKISANFTEISRKHVFAALNRNIIKNSLKKEMRTSFLKNFQFSISNLNLHS